jgi:hypothetical protein
MYHEDLIGRTLSNERMKQVCGEHLWIIYAMSLHTCAKSSILVDVRKAWLQVLFTPSEARRLSWRCELVWLSVLLIDVDAGGGSWNWQWGVWVSCWLRYVVQFGAPLAVYLESTAWLVLRLFVFWNTWTPTKRCEMGCFIGMWRCLHHEFGNKACTDTSPTFTFTSTSAAYMDRQSLYKICNVSSGCQAHDVQHI